MRKPNGYTLIELLIVIVVIGILAVIGIINVRSFSSTQILNDVLNKMQSVLREAQSNATAAVKCNGVEDYEWSVVFINKTQPIELKCKISPTASPQSIKQISLPTRVTVDAILGDGAPACTVTFPTNPMTVSFGALYGKVTFFDPSLSAACNASIQNLTVTLKYTHGGTTLTKNIIVSKGGGINEQ